MTDEIVYSPVLRLVVTRHEAKLAEGIAIPVYNWKIQRYKPIPNRRMGRDGESPFTMGWVNHVLMLSQPETLSSDELVETLESWRLTDVDLRLLRVVKEWEDG